MSTEKKPATPKAHELLKKLSALAERGINGEKIAAQRALRRLKSKWDFSVANNGGTDIFAGVFYRSPASVATPVYAFESHEYDIANAVKWAIEGATRIKCLFRGGQLCAEAAPETIGQLHGIAGTVAGNFAALWKQYAAAPGANPADRGNFVLGLYEGMMAEERHGEALPRRATENKAKKAKKRDVAPAPGLSVHPYTLAYGLGKQVRFCASLVEIAGELERTIRGEIAP